MAWRMREMSLIGPGPTSPLLGNTVNVAS